MPRSAGVFVLRHFGDAVRTGLRYAEVKDHRPSADRSADETPQARPRVPPRTPGGAFLPAAGADDPESRRHRGRGHIARNGSGSSGGSQRAGCDAFPGTAPDRSSREAVRGSRREALNYVLKPLPADPRLGVPVRCAGRAPAHLVDRAGRRRAHHQGRSHGPDDPAGVRKTPGPARHRAPRHRGPPARRPQTAQDHVAVARGSAAARRAAARLPRAF
jgi:hypothetical protein